MPAFVVWPEPPVNMVYAYEIGAGQKILERMNGVVVKKGKCLSAD